MAKSRHNAAFVVGAIAGGLAGATCALVIAPQAGAVTRALLKERLQPITDRAALALDVVREAAELLIERVEAVVAAVTGEELEPMPAVETEERVMVVPAPTAATDEVVERPGSAAQPPLTVPPVMPPSSGGDVVIDGPRPTMPDQAPRPDRPA